MYTYSIKELLYDLRNVPFVAQNFNTSFKDAISKGNEQMRGIKRVLRHMRQSKDFLKLMNQVYDKIKPLRETDPIRQKTEKKRRRNPPRPISCCSPRSPCDTIASKWTKSS